MSIFIITLLSVYSGTDGLRILPAPPSLLDRSIHQAAAEKTACHEIEKTDLMFVLDGSGSIVHTDADAWEKMENFTIGVINAMTLGDDAVRVGVVVFHGSASLQVPLSYDKAAVVQAVRNLSFANGGSTYYALGMGLARDTLLANASERTDLVNRMMIVVGDGISTDMAAAQAITSNFASTAGVSASGEATTVTGTVMTVAIGSSAVEDQLRATATTNNTFYSAGTSFDTLVNSVTLIARAATCNGGDVVATEAEETSSPPGVGGDPHVTNLAGNKFDIQKVGTYSLLTINQGHAQKLALALHASIDQVADACSAKYIQNASLSGRWLDELENSRLDVRVVHWIPKEEALQVLIGKEWHPVLVAKDRIHSDILTKTTPSQINVLLHGVTIRLSLGMNIRKVDKNQGYNFMNVNLKGLSSLDSSARLGGLLTLDDFAGVAEVPAECNARRAKLLAIKHSEDTQGESENDGQLSFLSMIDTGPEDISFFRHQSGRTSN